MIVKRKCIVTNEIKDRNDMIRIAKLNDGTFKVDYSKFGRGVYISKNEIDIDKIWKLKILHKRFKTNVPNYIYEDLKKILTQYNKKNKENL